MGSQHDDPALTSFQPAPHTPRSRHSRCLRAASLPLIVTTTALLIVLTTFTLQPPGTLSTLFSCVTFFYYRTSSYNQNAGPFTVPHLPSKEAYATFLSDISLDPMYLLQTRLLLYQFKHDPFTADSSRDFVVLTTPRIPADVEAQLKREGATVIQRPLITGMPGQSDISASHKWKDQYSKLHIFSLTQYERILYMDADTMLLKSMVGIWKGDGAWPESGFASVIEEVATIPAKMDGSEFNAGFWLARPSKAIYGALLQTDGYDTHYLEQALLNKYFSWQSDRPWSQLDPSWNKLHVPLPDDDLLDQDVVASIHGKLWEPNIVDDVVISSKISDLWFDRVEAMERHHRWIRV